MKPVTTATDISRLGTILSVWAHPDDESFASAGIMSTAAANGQNVVCITATKGEKGVQDPERWPAERLGEIRAEELEHALAILGIDEHYWLGHEDGSCHQAAISEAAGPLADYIVKYKPDTILTFGPEGMTGHPDHCAVSAWVTEAVKQAESQAQIFHAVELRENYEAACEADEKFNIFFNIDKPPLADEEECDILFRLPEDLLVKKYQAMMSMPSQYEIMFNELGQETVCRIFCSEAFVRADKV